MTELSFAKSFLTALDSRPTKISADYVEDPRNYPSRAAYILPKMARPLPKRQKISSESGERTLGVNLKSLRNPPIDITLHSLPLHTSVLNLKEKISDKENIPVDKIRILHKKKPIGDSKSLKDVAGDDETELEFAVMIIGGVAAIRQANEETVPPTVQGPSGIEVLASSEFWEDLNGFLIQRLRSEEEGNKAFSIFKAAWEKSSSS